MDLCTKYSEANPGIEIKMTINTFNGGCIGGRAAQNKHKYTGVVSNLVLESSK